MTGQGGLEGVGDPRDKVRRRSDDVRAILGDPVGEHSQPFGNPAQVSCVAVARLGFPIVGLRAAIMEESEIGGNFRYGR